MSMIPRPFQQRGHDAIFEYFATHKTGNPLICWPTGTGKSILPAMFCKTVLQKWPTQRIALLTHVKELVSQDAKAMHKVWPTAPISIYSAGLGKKEAHAPIVVGGIASVKNNVDALGFRDILFIDEAHLISPDAGSMYAQVIARMMQWNPLLRVIGLTATPFRMGQGLLTDPVVTKGGWSPALFTDVAHDLTSLHQFNKLIDDFYLCPLIPRQTNNVINVDDVEELGNDYNIGQLAASIELQGVIVDALEEAYELSRDRKSWIVFTAGIKNCLQVAEILNKMGIPACAIHSNNKEYKLSADDRRKRLAAFKAGNFRAIVSANILTTGFDHNLVDNILDLRPTTSVSLHIQKYGRGTRMFFPAWFTPEHLRYREHREAAMIQGGKLNCRVLDFAGNTERLGPINDPTPPKGKKSAEPGDAPVKICPECNSYYHTTAKECTICGYVFPVRSKLKKKAGTTEIIRSSEPEINYEWLDVQRIYARVHSKKGKPETLRIDHQCGVRRFKTWLAFDSKNGLAIHKAREWWRQHQGEEVPTSTAEAFDRFGECRHPRRIKIDPSKEYPEILEWEF